MIKRCVHWLELCEQEVLNRELDTLVDLAERLIPQCLEWRHSDLEGVLVAAWYGLSVQRGRPVLELFKDDFLKVDQVPIVDPDVSITARIMVEVKLSETTQAY